MLIYSSFTKLTKMIGKSLKKYNFPKTGIGDQKDKKKRENSTKIWKSRCEDRKVYTPNDRVPCLLQLPEQNILTGWGHEGLGDPRRQTSGY